MAYSLQESPSLRNWAGLFVRQPGGSSAFHCEVPAGQQSKRCGKLAPAPVLLSPLLGIRQTVVCDYVLLGDLAIRWQNSHRPNSSTAKGAK
jgi:hypothetical protein